MGCGLGKDVGGRVLVPPHLGCNVLKSSSSFTASRDAAELLETTTCLRPAVHVVCIELTVPA